MDFNYEIINEEFENDKIWIVILKFLILTTLKTMMEFNPNSNLKIFNLPNNKSNKMHYSILGNVHVIFLISYEHFS